MSYLYYSGMSAGAASLLQLLALVLLLFGLLVAVDSLTRIIYRHRQTLKWKLHTIISSGFVLPVVFIAFAGWIFLSAHN